MTTKHLKMTIQPTPEDCVYKIYLRCQKIPSIIFAKWGPVLQVVRLISFVSLQHTSHIRSINTLLFSQNGSSYKKSTYRL